VMLGLGVFLGVFAHVALPVGGYQSAGFTQRA
jgi:hypothetical protein